MVNGSFFICPFLNGLAFYFSRFDLISYYLCNEGRLMCRTTALQLTPLHTGSRASISWVLFYRCRSGAYVLLLGGSAPHFFILYNYDPDERLCIYHLPCPVSCYVLFSLPLRRATVTHD